MIKKILLTGDKGYLGSVLSKKLKESGFEVFGFDIKTSLEQDIRKLGFLERYSFVDCVIHLAGIVGDPNCNINILSSYDTNVTGTKNVVQFCKEHNLPLVFASTCSVYGKSESENILETDPLHPLSLYALTKKLNEEEIKDKLDNYLILRFGTLFGLSENGSMRYDLVINGMTKTAIEEEKITIFGGKQRRPFISLDELSKVIIPLLKNLEKGKQKEIYNAVAFNKTILSVGEEISRITNCAIEIEEKITDERDYSVSNERLKKIICPQNTFEEEVKKISDNLKNKINQRKEFLPFSSPSIGKEEIDEIIDTLKSGWISMGPKTIEFEKQLAVYIGVKHAISVNSCTAALHLSLIALGIKEGDEVITTPYTFTSTANVICHVGAKPVFVDIKEDTFNIDPEKIEQAITPRTKAIIVVHYGGQPADMEKIQEIAQRNNLKIIEDAAHAIGAEYNGKKIGSLGNLTCFSFYAIKNMTTGEGGAVLTNDDQLAEKLKSLRWYGINKDAWNRYGKDGSWYYEVKDCGWKYNMSDMQAALGIHQLKKLDGFIKKREEIACIYNEGFKGVNGIKIPFKKLNIKHAYHLYPILVENRNQFIEELEKKNIGTSVHFIPLHLHPFYQKTFDYKKGDFPVAEEIYEKEVSLPIYPKMTREDAEEIIKSIKEIKI